MEESKQVFFNIYHFSRQHDQTVFKVIFIFLKVY